MWKLITYFKPPATIGTYCPYLIVMRKDRSRQDLRARKVCYIQRIELRSVWLQFGDGGKVGEERLNRMGSSGGHGFEYNWNQLKDLNRKAMCYDTLLHGQEAEALEKRSRENRWMAPASVQERDVHYVLGWHNKKGETWRDLRHVYITHDCGRKSK